MGRLDGKVALITGAGRGQGRSHAVAMAREGADILALDCPQVEGIPYEMSSGDDLRQTVAEVEALGRQIIAVEGDVRRQDDLDRLVARGLDELGHIDVVVANAGVWSVGRIWELSETEWDAVADTCMKGTWMTIKAIAPHMIERQQGSIILVSSVSGVEGATGLAHYIAAKHGVIGLMKATANELGPEYGIRCNAILPGVIDTPILRWQGAYDFMAGGEGLGTPEHLEQGTKVWGALKGRGLLPTSATTNAAVWLASDESAHVTGVELLVDAGHRILPGLNTVAMFGGGAGASA